MQHLIALLSRPLNQFISVVLLSLIFILIWQPTTNDTFWIISGAFYASFILVNFIFFFFSTNKWRYFGYSMLSSLLYIFTASIAHQILLYFLPLKGSGESAMIFLIILYHPVILLTVLFIYWVKGMIMKK